MMTETVDQAALRLAAAPLGEGYALAALHAYTDADGAAIFWRIRLKHPASGEKWIRPMKQTDEGYVLGEPEFPAGKPLYRLHELIARPSDVVVVVEGEACVDALAKCGALATTSGGADSAGRADWSALAGREVRIWGDNDEAGRRYAETVAETLGALGCTVAIMDVAVLDLPAKGDAVDWFAAHPEASAGDVFALPIRVIDGADAGDGSMSGDASAGEENSEEEDSRPSQASQLVAFVEERAELFHDPNKDVYAQDRVTRETRRLDGRQFRDFLVAEFYAAVGKSPRDQSVREALSTLAGLARFRGECREVHVRVAAQDGAYYLDLGESGQSRAVCIRPGCWSVVSNPPVHFLRPETLRPLPTPEPGGDLAVLWRVANVPPEAQLLVIAWLVECLRPETPFPLLELIGEQGAAKSTTQTVLRRLIDPNSCDLRAAPKGVEDVFVGAGANWLVSYENISHLSGAMQDALCVLATGGGFAKRKLYSDADESVIVVKRPVVLNGISAAVTAQDLIDRTISVELPTIRVREETSVLWQLYAAEQGRLLGALLDVMAKALAGLPGIHLPAEDRPRLAEFARLGMAIAEAMGLPAAQFMAQFSESRQESIARTIDASPVAAALIDWFNARSRRPAAMPLKNLLSEIERYKPVGTEGAWPHSAKGLGDALRRAAPALRQMGIECRSVGKVGSYVLWEVKEREHFSSSGRASLDVVGEGAGEQDFKTLKTLCQGLSPDALGDAVVEVEL